MNLGGFIDTFKRTIQDCWHRRGFVAIGELLLEPIRPIQCRTTSTQWVSGPTEQRTFLRRLNFLRGIG